jgi:hypothetical protein
MTLQRPLCAALLLATSLGVAAEAQQASGPMVISSDPELAELAESLLPDLAARSGLPLLAPVRLERRSRDQLVRYLEAKLDEELSVEDARESVDAYALLGLVPPDLDLRGVLLGLYTEQIAGFYEPDSTALFVMDDQASSDLEALLVHELVHAIQDQNADLSALTGPDVGNDRATAAQAAIEGHATLVMMEFMAEQMVGMKLDLALLPDFAAQLRPALEAMRSQFPALAGSPRVIQESLLFPYLEGAGFVQALWSRGTRVAPFGENLPRSTEQVIERELTDRPFEVTLDVGGAEVVDDDVLGRLSMGVLIEEHLGEAHLGLASGWEGDRYALVELEDGTRGLVWYVLSEDVASRDRFVDGIGQVLDRFGGPASLERVEAAGHPATLLLIGRLADVTVRARVSEGS